MSEQREPVDPQRIDYAVSHACPPWCARHGDQHESHEDREGVHVSGSLVVNRTVLRLASSVDPETGSQDGPYVYLGDAEYTLHQAEVLIDVLTHLVNEGTGRTQVSGRRA